MSRRARPFSAIAAGGIVFAFLFQIFVNVGMTIGIAPVTGIPLPFVSVGGSSMIANLLAIGVLQAIHARGNGGRRLPLSAVRGRYLHPRMADRREAEELLMIEEADAWFDTSRRRGVKPLSATARSSRGRGPV